MSVERTIRKGLLEDNVAGIFLVGKNASDTCGCPFATALSGYTFIIKGFCDSIRAFTRKNISEDTFYYEQLRDCICNVMDKMAEDAKSGKGKGLASVSNDGYSENYAVQTEEQLRNELQSSIRAWLSGTGLAGAY